MFTIDYRSNLIDFYVLENIVQLFVMAIKDKYNCKISDSWIHF